MILKNNGFTGRTIGSCTIPLQPLIATSGNESTVWYTLKTEGKGNDAGEIEISLLFIKDLGEEGIVHATKEEEEDAEIEAVAATKGEVYVPPPRVVKRIEKQKIEKEKALDAGARLKLLKDLFYKIDVNGDKEVSQSELATMLESINADYEILEVYLREKCGLNVNGSSGDTTENVENESSVEQELTSAIILHAIDTDGDDLITWNEWCTFLGDGHQNYDAAADKAAKEKEKIVKPSKNQEKFQRLKKIEDAQDTTAAQEAARERERLAREKKLQDNLNAQKIAHDREEKRREAAHQRKLQELEDEKKRMAGEADRLVKLGREKALMDQKNADKIKALELRNQAAMEAMKRDKERRDLEMKQKKKEKRKSPTYLHFSKTEHLRQSKKSKQMNRKQA